MHEGKVGDHWHSYNGDYVPIMMRAFGTYQSVSTWICNLGLHFLQGWFDGAGPTTKADIFKVKCMCFRSLSFFVGQAPCHCLFSASQTLRSTDGYLVGYYITEATRVAVITVI